MLRAAARFGFLRVLPLGMCIVRVRAVVLRLEQRLDAHGVCRFRHWDRTGAGILAARLRRSLQ